MKSNLNLPFERIADVLAEEAPGKARCYVVKSIAQGSDEKMVQRGSGPNIMGDAITLCTCKHRMRTFHAPSEWEGKWIIGISGKKGNPHRAVFYIMKVHKAFESHRDLWRSQILSKHSKNIKAAHNHFLGDLFKPIDQGIEEPFNPDSYIAPENHSHITGWHKDINYRGTQTGRRAALLVGDPTYSYIWTKPTIFPRFKTRYTFRNNKLIELDRFSGMFGNQPQ